MLAVSAKVIDVQRDLALGAAISDIEAVVPRVRLRGGRGSGEYFDLSAVEPEEKDDVDRAVFYLSEMQRVKPHPQKAHLITILSAANA